MAKVLAGLRVVEMGTFITGPAAAMYLGDLGADVIKVERPGSGDPFRSFKGGLYSPHYQTYNRNKRAITLDTSKEDDRAIFHQLIETADVFIQNFRPGVAEKLGAGEAELKALNPRLDLLRDLRLGHERPLSRPPRLRHGRAGRERLPAPHHAARQAARHRPGDRRRDDRLLRRLRRSGGALRAPDDRQGPPHRRLDAGGDVPLQPRFLHALLLRRRDHGAAQPADGVAVLRLRMRRRKMAGAPHVVAAEVLGGARRASSRCRISSTIRASRRARRASSTRTI